MNLISDQTVTQEKWESRKLIKRTFTDGTYKNEKMKSKRKN